MRKFNDDSSDDNHSEHNNHDSPEQNHNKPRNAGQNGNNKPNSSSNSMPNDLDKYRPKNESSDRIKGGSDNKLSPNSQNHFNESSPFNNSDSNSDDKNDTDDPLKDDDQDSEKDKDKDDKDSDSFSDKDKDDGNSKLTDDSDTDKTGTGNSEGDDKDKDDGGLNKLNPLNKLKRGGKGKKSFKDFLKKQKRKNSRSDTEKLKRLTNKLARALQRLFNLLKLYTQAMRMFMLYKLLMAFKSAIAWITNLIMTITSFFASIGSSIMAFLAGLGSMIWAWIAGGIALIGLLIVLSLSAFFALNQQHQRNQLEELYQTICVKDKNKSSDDDDDGGDDSGGSATKGGSGKTVKLKPLKFKEYKDHRKNAISISKAVGKKAHIPASWAFAQIYAEESTYITGGTLQPVVTQDHNLTGMGPVGVSFGTGHAEGDGGYGHYDNYHQFAAAWAYTLNRMVPSKKYKTSARTYVNRLKAAGYFTADVNEYWSHFSAGLQNYKHGNAGGVVTSTGSEGGGDADDEGDSALDKAKKGFCNMIKPEKKTSGKWVYPFKGMTYKSAMSIMESGQKFGYGDASRTNSYHDGVDFGTSPYQSMGGGKIRAVHGGKVVKIGFIGHTQNDLGGYVVVHNEKDGWNIVYQEFLFDESDKSKYIKVHVGEHVDAGDTIGILKARSGVTHVHIGATKQSFNQAVSNSYSPKGGWHDVLKLIRDGIKNGGSDDSPGKGAYNPDHLSKSELAAREWIVQRESGGNWGVPNAQGSGAWGRYQLSADKFKSAKDRTHRGQTIIADRYAKERYGSWKGAKKFWEAHHWY